MWSGFSYVGQDLVSADLSAGEKTPLVSRFLSRSASVLLLDGGSHGCGARSFIRRFGLLP